MKHDRGPERHRRLLLSVIMLLLMLLHPGTPHASAENHIVRVGVYDNAPKIFIGESGQPAGIFIDIIEHIAKNEGWTLRYVPGSWSEQMERLAKGEIDLMPDVAYTAERAKVFSFSKVPALSSWFQVYSRKGGRIQSILDLRGKRIVVLENSIQQEAFKRMADSFGLHMTLVTAPDYKRVFEMAAGGEADAAVANHFYGALHARNYGLEDTAVVFNPSALYFAAPREGSEQLLSTIDGYLTELKKDTQSVYYASIKRWTSEEVSFALPVWMKITGLVLGLVLFISVPGSLVLKHQVNVRTRELRQANKEMEQRIIERTAELAASMEKAQAADRIKSAFLATMSHELRTPLNSIIGFTGILLQGLAGALNQEQQRQMTMVQNSARHLLSLINDVLDISKIEAGQLELSPADFDLKASIDKTVKLVMPLAEKKGLVIVPDVPDGLGIINADQRRLEQVVLNLLNNAVKFTEKGHIRISCRIEVDQCRLSVSDTGIGIREEELSKLFRPFHQIDSGIARKQEGTGLGLSICKKIVDMMGGSIEVESRWEQGSTFAVSFPVKPKALL